MNCARCLESGKETTATHFVKAIEFFHPAIGAFVQCENDGAKVCKPCLSYTLEQPTIRVEFYPLVAV